MSFNASEYANQYKRDNYDRISIFIPKGGKNILKEEADVRGYRSVGALIRDALKIAFDIEV